jgi:hypothetical protein
MFIRLGQPEETNKFAAKRYKFFTKNKQQEIVT